ncbi:transposase [Nostoc sp.]|uniref:transposase n=1 Tax=Nostoc sp. TaxID=1180 RepID=UPI003FA5C250
MQEILPTKKQTRPSNPTLREIFNGILYQLKNGCNWQDLPCILPPLFHRLLALA